MTALVAWLVWVPVNNLAIKSGSNIVVVIFDEVLASIFVGGLVGSVIGLLPLEGLPGGQLAKWRKDVWAIVIFVAMFLLIEVELRPASGPTHPGSAPVVTACVLFIVFGSLSLGTRAYFRHRAERKGPTPTITTPSDVVNRQHSDRESSN
jgi:hypothetical protein